MVETGSSEPPSREPPHGTPENAGAPRGFRGRRRLLAVALGIAAGALFSIPAPADEGPATRRAASVDAGRVTFRFEPRAEVVRGTPYDEYDTTSRTRWLLVHARVRVTDDTTLITFAHLLLLRVGGKPREPDNHWSRRDGESFPSLHPGLPEEVTFGWKLSKREQLGDSVLLLVRGQEYQRRNETFGWEQWRTREDAAGKVRLRVVDGKLPQEAAE